MRIVYIGEIRKNDKNDYTRILATSAKILILTLMLPLFDPLIKRVFAKVLFYTFCISIIDESITMFIKIMRYVRSNITLTSLVEVFEKINIGILFADSRGRIKMINPYMTNLLDYIGIKRVSKISEISERLNENGENFQ
ncbi:MAG: hypothetical protein Q4P31_00005, partial [Andreesenia angusta]|nr:hypothetical protein [Andreesenia angusta]